MVILIVAIISAATVFAFKGRAQEARIASHRASLKTVQAQVDLYFAENSTYPSAILPEWFAGNEFPHHPMNDAAIPPVHVFTLDDRTHPAIKCITGYGAFWYNSANGYVRARVADDPINARVVQLYNQVNNASLSGLTQTTD